jgi:hypothetical protein
MQLSTALRTIHADRAWWIKVLTGGAISLTFVGLPVVEGYQLESIENTQRGYPTPLPRWSDPGGKAIVGLFALILDFFFFIFPLLIAGVVLFCGTLAVGLNNGGRASTVVATAITAVAVGYLVVVWALGASPIAKQRYVKHGSLEQTMSGAFLRELASKDARRAYRRARWLSLPFYLVACGTLALSAVVAGWTMLGGVLLAWLGASVLLYARLVTIQLFGAATRDWERQRFEERQRAMGYGA